MLLTPRGSTLLECEAVSGKVAFLFSERFMLRPLREMPMHTESDLPGLHSPRIAAHWSEKNVRMLSVQRVNATFSNVPLL